MCRQGSGDQADPRFAVPHPALAGGGDEGGRLSLANREHAVIVLVVVETGGAQQRPRRFDITDRLEMREGIANLKALVKWTKVSAEVQRDTDSKRSPRIVS